MITGFDNNKTTKLLNSLNDEIEKKCLELREKKKAAMLKRVFFLGCIFAAILPVFSIFIGISLLTVLIPVLIFQAISLILLMPVILSPRGGINHVERAG